MDAVKDDNELRAALKALGQDVGPIIDSTREVYKRKYHALMTTKQQPTSLIKRDTHDEPHKQEIITQAQLPIKTDKKAPIICDDVEPSNISRAILWIISSFFIGLFSLYIYTSFPDAISVGQAFSNVCRKIILLGLFPSIAYGFYRLIQFFRKRRHQESEKVFELVEKILELLQSPDNPRLMPVLHIRDTMMTPSERKNTKMINLWEKTVRFIEEHESRVKVELVNIDGEDFRAWKWVGTETKKERKIN